MRNDDSNYQALLEAVFGPGTGWLSTLNGTPAAVDLTFEYGASQHQQAPDVAAFVVHWRPDSLSETAPLKIQQVTSDDEKSTLHITPETGLARFAGGYVTNVRPEDDLDSPPVSARIRLPVAEVPDDTQLVLDRNWQPTPGERYWLVSDPTTRAGWQELGRVAVQQPVESPVQVTPAIQASGRVHHPQAAPAPALPPSPTCPAQAAGEPDVTEILLDLALLEPDLFVGGTVSIDGGVPIPIRYSTAGSAAQANDVPAQVETARIGIARSDGWIEGTWVDMTLRSPAPDPSSDPPMAQVLSVRLGQSLADDALGRHGFGGLPQVVRARRGLGGELTWDEIALNRTVTRHVRVVSAPREQAGTDAMILVRSTMPNLEARLEDRICRYYAPYHVRFAVDLHGEPQFFPSLPIDTAAGQRRAYFSVLAIDNRQVKNLDVSQASANEGPLSAPAQITAIQPPPSIAPEPPIPCDAEFDQAIDFGQATPPDDEGRATVCLKWRYAGAKDAPAGMRFEVARGLASTIVASARRIWQRGGLTGVTELAPGLTLQGQLVLAEPAAGETRSARVRLMIDSPISLDKSDLIGSRVVQAGVAYARVLQAQIGVDWIDLRVEVLRGELQDGVAATLGRHPIGTRCRRMTRPCAPWPSNRWRCPPLQVNQVHRLPIHRWLTTPLAWPPACRCQLLRARRCAFAMRFQALDAAATSTAYARLTRPRIARSGPGSVCPSTSWTWPSLHRPWFFGPTMRADGGLSSWSALLRVTAFWATDSTSCPTLGPPAPSSCGEPSDLIQTRPIQRSTDSRRPVSTPSGTCWTCDRLPASGRSG